MVERDELHRRIMALRDAMAEGKLVFAEHLADAFREDLGRVRIAPDGLVDPESVSSRIRATALAVSHQKWREDEKKELSLREIQEVYFDLVESLFGEPHDLMKQAGTTPQRFAGWFASKPDQVEENVELFDEFLDRVESFWRDVGHVAWIHLEDSRQLKAVFAGEPFPNTNPAAGAGLYVDTIVLPDPFIRLAPVLRLDEPAKRVRTILRYALSVLEYRDIAMADVEVPIVVVLPSRHHLDENYQEFIHQVAGQDAIEHAGRVVGIEFANTDEAEEFFRKLDSVDAVMPLIERPELVLFSDEWDESLEEQVHKNWQEFGEPYGMSVGLSFWANFYNWYSQATDLLRRSSELRASPLIHASTVWRWVKWKLESSAERSHPGFGKDAQIVRVLGSGADGQVTWLGNVPSEALIEIRQVGALEELRELIGNGVEELALSGLDDFSATGERVVGNLSALISDHREAVKKLRKKNLRFAGVDLASFLVVGTIEVAAVAAGTPLFGGLAVAAALSGYVPSAKDLKDTSDALVREKERLRRGPVGILMRHIDLPVPATNGDAQHQL